MGRLLGQNMLETEYLKNARNWESNREENAGGARSYSAVHSPSVRAVGGEPEPASPPSPRLSEQDLHVCRILDELHLREPCFGSRKLAFLLGRDHQIHLGRKLLRRLMGILNIRTSIPAPGHKVFPYLLRNLKVIAPNQIWCADITYIPKKRGYCYLKVYASPRELDRGLADWFLRYNTYRPHQALGMKTPHEVHFQKPEAVA